ncbi:hypothetical protein [Kaistella sp.]|uniref:hypothetical protein n=1 Tax=Kaistella sp. TaxID=2782235 RepID=UPI002F93D417
MAFNENSRVKIPAILHLMRLGYQYIPAEEQNRIEDHNIFKDIFLESPIEGGRTFRGAVDVSVIEHSVLIVNIERIYFC